MRPGGVLRVRPLGRTPTFCGPFGTCTALCGRTLPRGVPWQVRASLGSEPSVGRSRRGLALALRSRVPEGRRRDPCPLCLCAQRWLPPECLRISSCAIRSGATRVYWTVVGGGRSAYFCSMQPLSEVRRADYSSKQYVYSLCKLGYSSSGP